MEITEVRIKLTSANNDKLRAFCSITLDNDFVIRDLKVIEGAKGPFVAMPSRKLTERCPRCGGKNPHRANFCSDCGCKLSPERFAADYGQRQKLHADIAHPINSRCRELIQKCILEHYVAELEKAKDPNYTPQDIDTFDEEFSGGESAEYPGEGSAFAPAPKAGGALASREGVTSSQEGMPSTQAREPAGAREGAEFTDWGPREQIPFVEEAASSGAGASGPPPQAGASLDRTADRIPAGSARGGGGAGTGYYRERGRGPRQREPSRDSPYSRGGGGGRRRDLDRRRQQGAGGPKMNGPRGRRDFKDGEGSAYRSTASEEARAAEDSRSRPFSMQGDLLRSDSPGLVPRQSLSEKRPMPAEAETEPEDNFGAGLFS